MKILVLVLLAMLVLSEAKSGGSGWKPVNKNSEIRFNSAESTIEVKTELQLNSPEIEIEPDVRRLVIEFCSSECTGRGEQNQRIEIGFTRRAGKAMLDYTIKHPGTIKKDGCTKMTSGELVWTFKKLIFSSMIHVQCNQAACDKTISVPDRQKIDRFRFGSGDTASLHYRVYSTKNGPDILPGENC